MSGGEYARLFSLSHRVSCTIPLLSFVMVLIIILLILLFLVPYRPSLPSFSKSISHTFVSLSTHSLLSLSIPFPIPPTLHLSLSLVSVSPPPSPPTHNPLPAPPPASLRVPTMMQPPCMTRPILFPSPLTIKNLSHVRMKTTRGKNTGDIHAQTQNKQTSTHSQPVPPSLTRHDSLSILLSLSTSFNISLFFFAFLSLSLPLLPLRDSFHAQISQ